MRPIRLPSADGVWPFAIAVEKIPIAIPGRDRLHEAAVKSVGLRIEPNDRRFGHARTLDHDVDRVTTWCPDSGVRATVLE
jgi:hypothetical protein